MSWVFVFLSCSLFIIFSFPPRRRCERQSERVRVCVWQRLRVHHWLHIARAVQRGGRLHGGDNCPTPAGRQLERLLRGFVPSRTEVTDAAIAEETRGALDDQTYIRFRCFLRQHMEHDGDLHTALKLILDYACSWAWEEDKGAV